MGPRKCAPLGRGAAKEKCPRRQNTPSPAEELTGAPMTAAEGSSACPEGKCLEEADIPPPLVLRQEEVETDKETTTHSVQTDPVNFFDPKIESAIEADGAMQQALGAEKAKIQELEQHVSGLQQELTQCHQENDENVAIIAHLNELVDSLRSSVQAKDHILRDVDRQNRLLNNVIARENAQIYCNEIWDDIGTGRSSESK